LGSCGLVPAITAKTVDTAGNALTAKGMNITTIRIKINERIK
tara:strand:- start:968 stop:1093 length:126 start_codon:yes stop_codon:yes gene_type:complete